MCNIKTAYVKINGRVKRISGCATNYRVPLFITDFGHFHNTVNCLRFTFNTHKVKLLKNNKVL